LYGVVFEDGDGKLLIIVRLRFCKVPIVSKGALKIEEIKILGQSKFDDSQLLNKQNCTRGKIFHNISAI